MTPTLAPRAHPSFLRRRLVPGALGLVLAAGLAACGESGAATCATCDTVFPRISMQQTTAPNDSSVAFTTHASDNLGIKTIHVVLSGPGISARFDTTFTTAVTSTDLPYVLPVPRGTPPGSTIQAVGSVMDGASNVTTDTADFVTGSGGPALVVITSPRATDTAVVGLSLAVAISGKTSNKVKVLGFIASGVFASPRRDSVIFASPLKDSIAVDTAVSLVGATTGQLKLQPFMIDSLQNMQLGTAVTVVVTNVATGTTPVVHFDIGDRIEVTDTIHVGASDRAGLSWLGYEVRALPSDPPLPLPNGVAADSFPITGSPRTHTFTMNLPITQFPRQVQVQAFARNTNGTRDYARTPEGNTGVVRVDTVTVVAGQTRALPNGGSVADALYHPPTQRLYLSNIDRNVLEVFDPATAQFDPVGISVGSKPWGIAAYPADRSGTMSNQLLVANSGGTLVSFVDVGAKQEMSRYPLPILDVQTITSTSGVGGAVIRTAKHYNLSSRPRYVAATCTGAVTAGTPCGDVVLVYTTVPTGGESAPLTNMSTVRWENLTRRSSHFFFEQAMGQREGGADTLQIDRVASGGFGADSTLVPFRQGPYLTAIGGGKVDTSYYSVVVQVPSLGFSDTTFARNSGNFARAVIGEGGRIGTSAPATNQRVMTYDVNAGMQSTFTNAFGAVNTLPVPVQDAGISRPLNISDFIANTSTSMSGIAMNFDGSTSAVRAGNTFVFDVGLRLQGILPTSNGNAGIDFHPNNTGIPAPGGTNGRQMLFAASDQPQIEVYNTNTYQRCLVVPTRDPVIGPIKSAILAGSTNIVLVGATVHGVVIVTIPQAQVAAACP